MNIQYRPFYGPADWGWIQQFCPLLRCGDTNGIMAIDVDKNETVAAIIFDNWTPNSCQIHQIIANPMVLRHGLFEEVHKFVFITAGRKFMMGCVRSDNPKALKLDKNIGFKEKFRMEDGAEDGVDLIFLVLTKADGDKFIERMKKREKVEA